MKTAHKIAAARALYRVLHASRAMAGLTDEVVATRGGIAYDLDLSQGIDLAIYLGMYERQTRAALRQLVSPGSLVLDIGANIGAHTLALAQLVGPKGQVLAFEPTDYAFQKLGRNLSLNPQLVSRVTAYHCFLAASDSGEVPPAVYSSWPLVGEDGLHTKHLGRSMETGAARASRLDTILAQFSDRKVQLVKLDVDGFECDVLRGATSLLREMRPIFVMEIAPYVLEERGSTLEEFLSFFTQDGYSLYDERTQAALPSAPAELRRLIGDGAGVNAIARVG
jgi:FkbM family methyltransferase